MKTDSHCVCRCGLGRKYKNDTQRSASGSVAFVVNRIQISCVEQEEKRAFRNRHVGGGYVRAEAVAINEVKWLSDLLREIGLEVASAPVVYGDNQSAQALSKNGIRSERTKHIAVKYAYIYYGSG